MNHKAKNLAKMSLGIALLAVGAWICIPLPAIPFTMQTFVLLILCADLGVWSACGTVLGYLAIGALGLPVFSGMQGGMGVLFGASGGFLFGFLPAAILISLLLHNRNRTLLRLLLAFSSGLALCYLVGVVWFALLYAEGASFGAVCLTILPSFLPDIPKTVFAAILAKRLFFTRKAASPYEKG